MSSTGIEWSIPGKIKIEDSFVTNIPILGDFMRNISVFELFIYILLPSFFAMPFITLIPFIGQYAPFVSIILVIFLSVLFSTVPEYTSINGIFSLARGYFRSPKQMAMSTNIDELEEISNKMWETTEDTVSITKIKRVMTDRGVIELDNGTIVSGMQVTGSNFNQTTNEAEIAEKINSVKEGINSEIDFDFQIYLPTRSFSTEFLNRYEDRLDDDDVQDNDLLQAYIRDYIANTREFYRDSNQIREYYVFVAVTEGEVITQSSSSGFFSLGDAPFIGPLFKALFADDVNIEEKRKSRQIQEAQNRLNTLSSIYSRADAEFSPITSEEYAILLKEFWEGENLDPDSRDEWIRNTPIISNHLDWGDN